MDHDAYYMVQFEDDNEFNNEVDTQNVVDEDITFMNEDSVDGDAILISLVQSHPYLYNKQLSDFKDSLKKENAWTEIANILNMKVDECHNRWTRLRERYSREKKQRQGETTTGSGVSKRKTFEFFDNLQFLDPFVKKRRTMTNVQGRNVSPSPRYCNLKKNFGARGEKKNLLQNSSNVQISAPPSTERGYSFEQNLSASGEKMNLLQNSSKVRISTPPLTGYSLEQNFGTSGEKENLSPANVTTSIRQFSIDCNPNSGQNIFKELRSDADNNEVVPRTFSPSLLSSLSKTPSPSPAVCIEEQTGSSNIRLSASNISDFEQKNNFSTLRIKQKRKPEQDLLQNTICKVNSLLEKKYSTTSSTLSINSEVQEDLAFCQLVLSLLKNLPQSEKTENRSKFCELYMICKSMIKLLLFNS